MAFIRAREIEDEIKHRGHERGTIYVLQVLAEQQIALQKNMRDQASMLNQMMDIIASLVTVGENMKRTIEAVNREDNDTDGLDRNTQQLGDKN